jgi:hypothetical protein
MDPRERVRAMVATSQASTHVIDKRALGTVGLN